MSSLRAIQIKYTYNITDKTQSRGNADHTQWDISAWLQTSYNNVNKSHVHQYSMPHVEIYHSNLLVSLLMWTDELRSSFSNSQINSCLAETGQRTEYHRQTCSESRKHVKVHSSEIRLIHKRENNAMFKVQAQFQPRDDVQNIKKNKCKMSEDLRKTPNKIHQFEHFSVFVVNSNEYRLIGWLELGF